MSDVVFKSKLAVNKDLGKPINVWKIDGDNAEYLLGTVIGVAHDIKKGMNPQGLPFSGLKGTFEGIPSDPERDTIRSGVCYLPAGFQEPIEAVLAAGEANVKFAFEVYSIKRGENAYSFKLKPLFQPKATDPLEDFRKELPKLAAPVSSNAGKDKAGEKAKK